MGSYKGQRGNGMTTNEYEYKGHNLQRMGRDNLWYVIKENKIVNHGQYREELQQWIDKQEVRQTCRVCNKYTGFSVSINLKAVPVCNSCSKLFTKQQVLYLANNDRTKDPL